MLLKVLAKGLTCNRALHQFRLCRTCCVSLIVCDLHGLNLKTQAVCMTGSSSGHFSALCRRCGYVSSSDHELQQTLKQSKWQQEVKKMVDCSLRVGSDLLLQVREISLVSLFECEGKTKCILDRHFSVESAEMQALYEAKKELCLQAQLSIQANLHSSPHQWLRDLGRNRKKKKSKISLARLIHKG